MALAARFKPLPASGNMPRAARRRLLIETGGTVADGRAAEVTILNVSESGLLLETAVALAPLERIEIDLPNAGPTPAEVVWSDGPFHGCRFSAPLTAATLRALELRAAPSATPASPPAESATFADQLRRTRKQRGLTLAAIAEALGVSKPTVWAWEQGRARPIPQHMVALAGMLGLDAGQLADNGRGQRLQAVLVEARQQVAEALQIDPAKVRFIVEL